MTATYRPPLAIYVIWHPQFAQGKTLAEGIFKRFCRDSSQALGRGIGIPVFFRSELKDGQLPSIPLDDADHTMVVPLVDDHLVVDDAYRDRLIEVADKCMDPAQAHRVISIGLSPGAFSIPKVKQLNLLALKPLHESVGSPVEASAKDEWEKNTLVEIKRALSVELCRILLHTEDGAADQPVEIYGKKANLRLFLSYARKDGRDAVIELLLQTVLTSSLNVFWDETAIARGYDFGEEIRAGIRESVLVVFLTDVYASRDWCLREVVYAKESQRPILVVNALEKEEVRSFPYLGNVPTMRWEGDKQAVIDRAIQVALDFFYQKRLLKAQIAEFKSKGVLKQDCLSLARPPELLDITTEALRAHEGLLFYPDPPLTTGELTLVKQLNRRIHYLTPNYLPSLTALADGVPLLAGKRISVSISESDQVEMAQRGFGSAHQLDSLLEFFRYVFAGGADVMYGGHLEKGGFTQPLIDLAGGYRRADAQACFYSLVPWPFSREINVELQAKYFGIAKFMAFPADPALHVDPACKYENLGPNELLAAAASNTAMRQEMAKREDARILMGGKLNGYTGFVPGLLEEAYSTLKAGKPLYLLGALGGCTGAIITLLRDQRVPHPLTDAHCRAMEKQARLHAAYDALPNRSAAVEAVPRQPEALANWIREQGLTGLNNGLSEAENLRLFETPYVPEMVSLVLKGLSQVFKNEKA